MEHDPCALACTARVPITSSASTPGNHQQRPAHGGARHGVSVRSGLRQIVRHGGPVGLVFRVHVVAESFTLGIEHTGNIGRRIILDAGARSIVDQCHTSPPPGKPARIASREGQARHAVDRRGTDNWNHRPVTGYCSWEDVIKEWMRLRLSQSFALGQYCFARQFVRIRFILKPFHFYN